MSSSDDEDMKPDVDVFVSNYTFIDHEIYQLWVDGVSPGEAVEIVKKGMEVFNRGSQKEMKASRGMLTSEVLDHYRTYGLLEKLLYTPTKLSEQLQFQIEPQTRRILIEKYYMYDDAVFRELLGKKLSSRHRKDLDDLSEKTNKNLLACRRQFDNAKRVCKTVEEMPGLVVQNIKDNFLLTDDLARCYAAVVFLGSLRFECNKRRMQYLSFQDLVHCAHEVINGWTCTEPGPEQDDTELDRDFLLDLRDLRVLADKDKEHKHLVCAKARPLLLDRTFQDVESNFRSYTRAILSIAGGLHRSREMRGLFADLVEKCLEPWHSAHWTHPDLKNFLSAYTQSALEMDILREADLKAAWERYMGVLSNILLRMYHL
ncbi:hypothetical protein B566_EDAN004055 [Ephemera danica]|nr:hypothetical protein B566_EDAN004055 [Ephemera danica]